MYFKNYTNNLTKFNQMHTFFGKLLEPTVL